MPWIYNSDIRALYTAVDRLTTAVNSLKASVTSTGAKMTALDDAINNNLIPQVTANTNAENSAVTLIQQLADLIQANATSPQTVIDLATKLKNSAGALGAAVVANTPTAPPANSPTA